MAFNTQNLRKLTTEQAREIGRKGGKASVESKRRKKTLREDFETLLSQEVTNANGQKATNQENMVFAMLKQALDGNVRAAEYIRDIIGQKPVENLNINTPDADIMLQVRRRMNER